MAPTLWRPLCRYITIEFGQNSSQIMDKKTKTIRLKTAVRKKNLKPSYV